MYSLLAVDDGIWQGNFDFADILFIVATVLFIAAAVLDFTRHTRTVDDAHAHHPHVVYTIPLIALGLAFTALAFAVL